MSLPELYIQRRTDISDFDQLRDQMIDEAQKLSGHEWTDFNLHDPGVTIIEQLCYALTDINARSGNSVPDLLTDENGHLDLKRHALFSPATALTCRPVTLADYQEYFLSRIDNLKYMVVTQSDIPCHYDIYIKPGSSDYDLDEEPDKEPEAEYLELKQKIRSLFNQVRNLGEDINRIIVIPEKKAEVIATLDIEASNNPERLLATVYLRIRDLLTGQGQNLIASSESSSSTTDHHRKKLYLKLANSGIPIPILINSIRSIKGIRNIQSFHIDIEGNTSTGNLLPALKQCYLQLLIPHYKSQLKIRLLQRGQPVNLNVQLFQESFRQQELHQQAALKAKSQRKMPTIASEYPALSDYISIQTQFPDIYGINLNGVPKSSGPERQAKALQLKGYLMLFDQLLSDHCAMIDSIKNLFSTSVTPAPTYPSHALTSDSVGELDKLYIDTPQADYVQRCEPDYDQSLERKGRALDYLLALNGREKQTFGFEFFNPYFSEDEAIHITLKNKQQLLEAIHEFLANRGAGFDYTSACWGSQNLSMLERYVALVLGVKTHCRSFILPLRNINLKSDGSKDQLYFDKTAGEWKTESEDINFFYRQSIKMTPDKEIKLLKVPLATTPEPIKPDYLEQICQHLHWSSDTIIKDFFCAGVNPDNYRMYYNTTSRQYELYLSIHNENNRPVWHYLSSFVSEGQIQNATCQLQKSLVDLNLNMEGLHLVEHCLLRPVCEDGNKKTDHEHPEFYHHQISVVLPGWSVRFRNTDFRQYAETLIRAETPAHLYVHIHWLSYSDMEKFEILFKNWLFRKRKPHNIKQLNRLSQRLVALLSSFKSC